MNGRECEFGSGELVAESCSSGESDDAYWVSLGFSGLGRNLDCLHIECGKELDEVPGFQGLYFERGDQGESEYDLAESIIVTTAGIEINFRANGASLLHMPSRVRFAATTDPEWSDFVRTFGVMAETPNGVVIKIQAS